MMLLAAVVLSAAPLSVRVLEHERPVRAHVEAVSLTCDGAPLPTAVDVAPGLKRLEASGRACGVVAATGDVRVTLEGGERPLRFAGRLVVMLAGGGLRLINEVDIEDYLPSVVEAEARGTPTAALQAQAVVSRTFALAGRGRHGREGYDLCDQAHCQVYRGLGGDTAESRAAVQATRDQVLLSGGVALRPVSFHASCGGHTSRPRDVFGNEEPGDAVSDMDQGGARCREAPDVTWEYVAPREELAAALGARPDGQAVEVLRRDVAGRALEVRAFGKRMTGEALVARLGRAFGSRAVPSARFTVNEVESQVRFSGSGRGHGAGLCQAGAAAMAKQGADWRAILRHYFPGARVAPAP